MAPSSVIMSRSGGEKGLRGSGAGTLGVPLEGTRHVGGLLGLHPSPIQVGHSRSFPLRVWHSRLLVGGARFVEKSKATSCPIRGPGSHDPPCPAPARAAQAPSPSVGGRTFVPSGASVLCAGPDCPFSYHRKRAAGPDPHHDHPFLDPDSSPSDHRGRVARTQPTRGRRSSSSFVCREPMRRRPFLSVVRPDR